MTKEQLEWQIEMGADEAVEETTKNRLAQAEKVPAETAAPVMTIEEKAPPSAPKKKPASGPQQLIAKTREIATAADTLEALEKAVRSFDDIALSQMATNVVFADGVATSDVMLIGEAPGAEEDKQGIPFCGASGKLLDKILATINLSRQENCYITNTLFWRPPGNRRPTPEEIAICRPFIERHIALVKPKLIILVGGTAVSALLEDAPAISKMRGNFTEYNNQYLDAPIAITAVFHPSYLLRSPGQKKLMWYDMLKVEAHLKA